MSTTFWIKALELILALGILVMIHEFGHYFFARIFGVWVEKFYLFFNPWLTIAKWKPGKYVKWFSHGEEMGAMEVPVERQIEAREVKQIESTETKKAKQTVADATNENKKSWRATEYGLGWLPLGGYCAISGMIDESMNTEAMKEPAKPYEFRSKPAWKRLLIMLGGVLFNFLLAIIIYSCIAYSVGEEYVKFSDAAYGITYSDSAHAVGFADGDIPLRVDGKPVDHMTSGVLQSMVTSDKVTVLRDGKDTITIDIPEKFIFDVNKDVTERHQRFMTIVFPVVVDSVLPDMGAAKAGLQQGDRIVAVGDVSTLDASLFSEEIVKYKNQTVNLTIQRDGQTIIAESVPVDTAGMIGVHKVIDPARLFNVTNVKYNILQSIPHGIKMGWEEMINYVRQLKYVLSSEGAQSLGGFGAIGSIFPDTWDWLGFWRITAWISIILAVMNVLPIPALDGGHVMFLIYEMVTGRQPSLKFMERAQMIGMILLIALLLFANGNDLYRYFFK